MGFFSKKKENLTQNGTKLYDKGRKAYQEKEYEKAEKYLLDACQSNVWAVLFLGELYCDGFLHKDEKDAFKLYETYVDQIKKDASYSKVMFELAKCYHIGKGTRKDRIQAIDKMELCRVYDKSFDEIVYHKFIAACYIELWNDISKIHKAKEENHFEEFQEDAYEFMNRKKYNKKNEGTNYALILNHTGRKGFRHLELAGEAGDALSSYECANFVAMTWFTNQYSEPIYKYLKMANDGGIHYAAADMYWRYINGFYQNASPGIYEMEDTVKRLKKGAEAKDADCQLALALCYTANFINAYGYGYHLGNPKSPLEPDDDKFIYWLEKAASQSCPEAKILWAEYLAFGKIWTKNDDLYPRGLLYENENCKRNPVMAMQMLKSSLKELEERQEIMHEYRKEKFIHKAQYLLNQLEKAG